MIEKKSIRNLIVKLLFNDLTKSLFSLMFLNKLTIGIFNYVFENSPGFLLEVFVRLSKQPDFDFIWKVLLSDKSKVFWAGLCLVNYLHCVYDKDIKKKKDKENEIQSFFNPKDKK